MGHDTPTWETQPMPDDAPATGTDATDTTTTTTTDTTTGTVDQTAEIEKWKAQARKHEDRAKANAQAAKDLEALRLQSMTDQEKAVETAKAQARAEVLAEVGADRVADAFRVAAADRTVDIDTMLGGLDASKFMGDDGQPDRAAIQAWVDKVAPKPSEEPAVTNPALIDLGQGARNALPLNGDPLLKSVQNKLGIN